MRAASICEEKPRLLLVDDEAAVLFAFNRIMGKEGFIVDLAATLQEAEAFIAGVRYDFVITDIRLSGSGNTDGLDLLRYLNDCQPSARPIVVTGYGNSELEKAVMDLGAVHYFEKPVLPHEIIRLMRSYDLKRH